VRTVSKMEDERRTDEQVFCGHPPSCGMDQPPARSARIPALLLPNSIAFSADSRSCTSSLHSDTQLVCCRPPHIWFSTYSDGAPHTARPHLAQMPTLSWDIFEDDGQVRNARSSARWRFALPSTRDLLPSLGAALAKLDQGPPRGWLAAPTLTACVAAYKGPEQRFCFIAATPPCLQL